MKFEEMLQNHSPVNAEIFIKKSKLVLKKLHFFGETFLIHPVYSVYTMCLFEVDTIDHGTIDHQLYSLWNFFKN
jgi:hypothetical protein